MTFFTEESIEQLYLREDLEADADLVGFAETERLGFRSQVDYSGSELGDYRFTIRVFEHGYLTRVIANGTGVFVTTDPMSMERFEELGVTLAEVLGKIDANT